MVALLVTAQRMAKSLRSYLAEILGRAVGPDGPQDVSGHVAGIQNRPLVLAGEVNLHTALSVLGRTLDRKSLFHCVGYHPEGPLSWNQHIGLETGVASLEFGDYQG